MGNGTISFFFTTLVCPHHVIPVKPGNQVLWRVLDTRLRGYDGDPGCGPWGHTAAFMILIGPFRVIPAEAGIQVLHNLIPKVVPLWIVFFNKTKLPLSVPFLELFFSRNC